MLTSILVNCTELFTCLFLVRHQDKFKPSPCPMASLMDLQLLCSPFPVELAEIPWAFESETFVLLIELGFISISNSSMFSGMRAPHRQPDLPDLLNGNQQAGALVPPFLTSTGHWEILFRILEKDASVIWEALLLSLCNFRRAAEKPHTLHLRR